MNDLDLTAFADQVADDIRRVFGAGASTAVVDQYARDAVLDLWMNGPRITLHVADLALRQVRNALASAASAAAPNAAAA